MKNLPFDRLLAQPQQYQDQYPPVNLQPQRNTEWGGLIPIVTARMANDIATQAQVSYARTYVFNLLSDNNWNNPDFRETVGLAFTFLEFFARVMQNPIEQAMQQAIALAGRLVVATSILESQLLAGYCSQDVINASRAAVATFQEANGKLQLQLNMDQSRTPQMQLMPLNPFSNFTPVATAGTGWGGNYSTPHVSTLQQSRATVGQASMFQQENDTARMVQSSSRFGAHVSAVKEREAAVLPPPTPAPILVLHPSSAPPPKEPLKWVSTSVQPYRLWCDPFVEQIVLKEETTFDGNKCVIEDIILLEHEQMQQEQHELPMHGYTVNIPKGQGVAPATALKEAQAIAMQKRDAEEIIAGLTDTSNDIRPTNISEMEGDFPWLTSVEQLIFQTKLKAARDGTCAARGWASVPTYTPFIHEQREHTANWLAKMRECKTLTEMAALFDDIRTNPIHAKRRYPEQAFGPAEFLFRRIETQMTQAINDVLRIQLSMGIDMDEFSIDYPELLKHVAANYSKKYSELLQSVEQSLLDRFQAQFEGDQAELIGLFGPDAQEIDDDLYIDGTVDNYSVTVLPYTAADLGLHRITEAVLVTHSRQPALHLLIKNTFSVAKTTKLPYTAHYLVLLCGKRLRMHKGLLVDDAYLISL